MKRIIVFAVIGLCGFLGGRTLFAPAAKAVEAKPKASAGISRAKNRSSPAPPSTRTRPMGIPCAEDFAEGREILPPETFREWTETMPGRLWLDKLARFLRGLSVDEVKKVTRMFWAIESRDPYLGGAREMAQQEWQRRDLASAVEEMSARCAWERRSHLYEEDLDLEGDLANALDTYMGVNYEAGLKAVLNVPSPEYRRDILRYLGKTLDVRDGVPGWLETLRADTRLTDEERMVVDGLAATLKKKQEQANTKIEDAPIGLLAPEMQDDPARQVRSARIRRLAAEDPAALWTELSGVDPRMQTRCVLEAIDCARQSTQDASAAIQRFLAAIPTADVAKSITSAFFENRDWSYWSETAAPAFIAFLADHAQTPENLTFALSYLNDRESGARILRDRLTSADEKTRGAMLQGLQSKAVEWLGADVLQFLPKQDDKYGMPAWVIKGLARIEPNAAFALAQQQGAALKDSHYGRSQWENMTRELPPSQQIAAIYLSEGGESIAYSYAKLAEVDAPGAIASAVQLPDAAHRRDSLIMILRKGGLEAIDLLRQTSLPKEEIEAVITKANSATQ